MRKRSVAFASVVLSLCLAVAPAPAGVDNEATAAPGWPQWRGPQRNAVSSETGLLDEWSESGPPVLWRLEIGQGFSGVSISEGMAYTLWDENEKQLLVCLDAATGEMLWSRELGAAFEHHYGNGPRSTPLVEKGMVYAIGTGGKLLAADARSGKSIWERDLVRDFHSALPAYGYASSPLATDGKLVVEAGGSRAAFVALDMATGEVKWAVESDKPAYSSPIVIEVAGVSQVIFWSAHGLHSVASSDGRILWRYPWETFCPVTGDPLNTGTPIFIPPDRVFISSSSGAAVIGLVRRESAFEVVDVWKSQEVRSDINTGLLLGDHVYAFDHGTLKSLDAATGAVTWKARGYERGSIIAADGKLIVLGENGVLALLNADPAAYVERSRAPILQGRSWTSASLAAGRLYLRNQGELVCLDLRGRREPRRAR